MNTRIVWSMAFLAIIGLILSSYLLFHHYQIRYGKDYKSVCNLNDKLNCDAVALHPASELFGIPVAAFGIFFYGFLLACLRRFRKKENTNRVHNYFNVILLMALVFDLYLFAISWIVIKVMCPFCIITYIANAILLILAIQLQSGLKTFIQSLGYVMKDLGWGES